MNIKIIPPNYKIEFTYGACVYIDATTVDNIYSIDIYTVENEIKFNGIDGFVMASTIYEHTEEIGCCIYDKNDNIDRYDEKIICKNGKLNLKLFGVDRMKIKEILKPFVEKTKEFIRDFGNKTHRPLENDDIGKFYIMICENGGYYQVDMENSYWYEEDDGTVVFRVNDTD